MRLFQPVRPGDTIHVEVEVTETRPTRHPSQGVTIMRYHIFNQHHQEVMTCDMAFLMHREEESEATG